MTKTELQEKLARGRLEDVLESLQHQTKDLPDRSLHRDALQLAGRFSTLQRESGLGVADPGDRAKALEEIRATLLRLIDELPNHAPVSVDRLWLKNPPALRYRDVAADRKLGREVWQSLRPGNLILHGTGGMGKTTLAKIIVGEYGRHFKHVAWLEAADGLPLLETLLAQLVSLPASQNLLIVDDLQPEPDQIVQLEQLRERLPGWRILVTSRGQFSARGFGIKPQPLVPSSRQARRIFRHYRYAHSNITLGAWLGKWMSRLRRPSLSTFWTAVDEFSREIGCNTLALEMTAKTLRANPNLDLTEFRRRLKDRHLDDRDLDILVQTGYLKAGEKSPAKITAYKCLRLAFEQATALSPAEQRLLKILALLPPLSWVQGRWIQDLGLDADGSTQYVNAENDLILKGLLEWDRPPAPWWQFFSRRPATLEEHYRLHPLVQQMLHYLLRPGLAETEPLFRFLEKKTEVRWSDYLRWWIAAVDYLLEYGEEAAPTAFWTENLWALANKLDDLNATQQALRYSLVAEQHCRALAAAQPAVFEPFLAEIQDGTGYFYHLMAQYETAQEFYCSALVIRERLVTMDAAKFELDLVRTQRRLANVHFMLNDSQDEPLYQSALHILRRRVQDATEEVMPMLAMTLLNLGQSHRWWGRYTAAEEVLLESLETYERLAQSNSEQFEADWADAQEELAILYYKNLERPEAAEALLNAALETWERLVRSNPARFEPELASYQTNVGLFYNNYGRYPEAERAQRAAVEIYERLVLTEQERFEPGLAQAYIHLGVVFLNQPRLPEARDYFESAEQIYARIAPKAPQRFHDEYARLLYFKALLAHRYFLASGEPAEHSEALALLHLARQKLSVFKLAELPYNQDTLKRMEALEAQLWAGAQRDKSEEA